MASPDTAAALLTAQSILIAALAVVLQRHEVIAARVSLESRLPQAYAILTGGSTGIAFLGSIAYLHVAEYPSGFVARLLPPQFIFNVTTFMFVMFVYTAFSFVMYVFVFGDPKVDTD